MASHFRPIFPACLLNEDCGNQYYFAGTARGNLANNRWARVNKKSFKNREKDPMWTGNECNKGV